MFQTSDWFLAGDVARDPVAGAVTVFIRDGVVEEPMKFRFIPTFGLKVGEGAAHAGGGFWVDIKRGVCLLKTGENSHEGCPSIEEGDVCLEFKTDFLGVWRGGTTVGGGGLAGRRAAGIAGGRSRSRHCFCCFA